MRKTLFALMLVVGLLTGCGRGHPVAYRPIAFGENNQCYYVQNPAEVIALQQQGLCDPSWAPAVMPSYWHMRYWNYYSSPAYYTVYVPAPSRAAYSTAERSWGSGHQAEISTAARQATYKGSNGKTVTAEKIGAAKFGGGARFGPTGTKFGGGARTAPVEGPAPKSTPTPAPKAEAPKSTPTPRPPAKPSSGPKPSSGGSKSFGGGSRGVSGGGSHSFGGGHR